eukprot:403366357
MATPYNMKFLEHEHKDVAYLKRPDIGLVLSRALSETYQQQPSKPIEFFAKFLLNHSKTQKKAQAEKEREKQIKELRDRHAYFVMAKKAEIEETLKEDRLKQKKQSDFYDLLEKSQDLTDNLDELAQYLQDFTGATGVYIGKLIQPRKEIQDEDDDRAHIDNDNPKVVWYIHSSQGHEYMKGKILSNEQGVTHAVFNPPQVENEAEQYDEEGNLIPPKPKSTDILDTNHHVFVREVVREPKIHFYKVPRLGSYLAIPLVYNSCLFEDALDNAVSDYFAVQKAREEQDKARQEYEEEQNRIREEKERLGDYYEAPEPREWEVIKQKDFETFQESFVVCLDTMGQDREFTDVERRLALQAVQNFKEIWERTEFENLTRDRNRKIKIMEIDREFMDVESHKLMEEEDKHVEEYLQQHMAQNLGPDGQPAQQIDEELKDLIQKSIRLQYIAQMFRDKVEYQKSVKRLTKYKVLKLPRIMQSIFYFLQYKREQICEKGTNKFFWKIAKTHFNNPEFFNRLVNFNPMGSRDEVTYLPRYQTINFIERNIEGINPEDVDAYNMTIGKLFKWLLLAIRTRKDDIIRRKALQKKAREHRDSQIEKSKAREIQHANDLRDAQQKFLDDHRDEIDAYNKYQQDLIDRGGADRQPTDEDAPADGQQQPPVLPVFNEADWQVQWLNDNPEVQIPEQVVEDKDIDWYMTIEEEDQLISQYFLAKETSGIIPPVK